MLPFALGLALGVIFSEILHAHYRYPWEDNSEAGDTDLVGDIVVIDEEKRERYWKKVIPSDVHRTPKRTIVDN